MPIEREFKYVLKNTVGLEDELKTFCVDSKQSSYDVEQGYLSRGGRIRSKTYSIQQGEVVAEDQKAPIHWFTYKHDLTSHAGVLEIECQISKEDYDLAWVDADHTIIKTRYVIKAVDGLTWEIDFFRNSGHTYLVLAECEVDADKGAPETLHPFVEQNLLLAVAETDGRFKNRKLCNPKKVAKLLKEIV